ncbi:MAG: hypothetical protein ACYCVD_09705 [Desulfitobacteriaceae bacterium]
MRLSLNFWRYQLILFLLYFLWSGFFTSQTLLSQAAFNFAIFYPVGVLTGYRREQGGIKEVYVAALVFDLLTYGLAILGGGYVENWSLIAVDFFSMILFIGLGILIGGRMRNK